MSVKWKALNYSENANSVIYEWGLWVLWWGRWDLNPGSLAPQASILIHVDEDYKKRSGNQLHVAETSSWP